MGLLEDIEADKKALAELEAEETNKEPNTEEDNPEDNQEEDEEDGNSETTTEDEDGGDESGDEETSEEEEEKKPVKEEGSEEKEPDATGYARLRREKQAAERRAEEAESKLSSQSQESREEVSKEKVTGEPDIQADPLEWLQWNNQRVDVLERKLNERDAKTEEKNTYNDAKTHFLKIESEFTQDLVRSGVDDYEDVSTFLAGQIASGIRALDPYIGPELLAQKVEQEIINRGSNYFSKGLNPAEELYHQAKEVYGYKPKEDDSGEEEESKEIKPDLKQIAKNRKRNSGMAGSGGTGGSPQITREVAAGMSMAEWSKMPKTERKRLMGGE